MDDQALAWSRAAEVYEKEFIDPYADSANNRVLQALDGIDGTELTAADLGCGIGPLLPRLAARFKRVVAVDFAAGMLQRAKERCTRLTNVAFEQRPLTDLTPLHGAIDVAVAVNSLVLPDLGELEAALAQARACLRPGGHFLGVVPAIDAVQYHTMLLVDRARRTGMPDHAARANAAQHAEHSLYDFAFGGFRYLGLVQHFWQPFEVRYRLRRAGFREVVRRKQRLPWSQCARGGELKRYPPTWDWFFHARA
jgi:SAM-dependent methyltransferase